MEPCAEWREMRARHPFAGEGLSDEAVSRIWDGSADSYSEAAMGDAPDRIAGRLMDMGIVREGASVMDVGCGPGVYGMRFARVAGRVVCLDRSPRMLERLSRECAERGAGNVSAVLADWPSYPVGEAFDAVFSSLCPPLNCESNLLKMESHSKGWCAYVSSMGGDMGSLHTEIWRRLGKDYTYKGYDTSYPCRYLRSLGRDARLEEFEARSPSVRTVEEAVAMESKRFSAYGRAGAEVEAAIREAAESRAEDGLVRSEGIGRLGLLTWRPPGRRG
ncbi:MAG: class I SAM-dependent methyltransferase [Candidatus Methanoplasma sp.]|jgi:SAM-dependent methyltransferase|nr:class I SAM-dependent methyltransferase [Candidatus Methanoplasma sp.]